MKKLNLYKFYLLGAGINPMRELGTKDRKLAEIALTLFVARGWLRSLLDNSLVPLKISRTACQRLFDLISEYLPRDMSILAVDSERTVSAYELRTLSSASEEVETLISAELAEADAYFVDQKGAYSTPDLIFHAEIMFPKSIQDSLPKETKSDIRQAGRCLAFDLPTAAGFHTLRATESVIRQWYSVVVGKTPPMKMRNWGAYIRVLKKQKADHKIISILDQIREMYRNPVLHPEITLTPDEALTLLGICQSAIVAIVVDIQKRGRASTGLAALQAPPPPP